MNDINKQLERLSGYQAAILDIHKFIIRLQNLNAIQDTPSIYKAINTYLQRLGKQNIKHIKAISK